LPRKIGEPLLHVDHITLSHFSKPLWQVNVSIYNVVRPTLSLLYVYFTSCYTSNVYRQSRVPGINALFFFIYILSILYMSSLSSPPHLVRLASRPFSGKNFGAVCSGVVSVPLDELLPPPVPLASLVLGCARPMAE
jgi:hypothetical protein